MQPTNDQPKQGFSRQLRRYGPILAVVVVVGIVAAVLVASGGDDDNNAKTTDTTTGKVAPPEGAISFSKAKKDNLDVTFGPGCDQTTGNVAIPFFFAPECYANVKDNGGATATGVTADTIKVVLYLPQP